MQEVIEKSAKKNRIKLQYDFVPEDRYIYGYHNLEDRAVFTVKSPYLKVLKPCHRFKNKNYFIVALEQDLDADGDVEQFIGKIRKMDDLSKECILKNALKWYGKNWDIFTIDSMTRYPIDEQKGDFYMKLILPPDDGEYSELYRKIGELEKSKRDSYVSMTIYFKGIKWSRETFTEEWFLEDFQILEEKEEEDRGDRSRDASLGLLEEIPRDHVVDDSPKRSAGALQLSGQSPKRVDDTQAKSLDDDSPSRDVSEDHTDSTGLQQSSDKAPSGDPSTFLAPKVQKVAATLLEESSTSESSPHEGESLPHEGESWESEPNIIKESLDHYEPEPEPVNQIFPSEPQQTVHIDSNNDFHGNSDATLLGESSTRRGESSKSKKSKKEKEKREEEDVASVRSGKSLGSQRVKKVFHFNGKMMR